MPGIKALVDAIGADVNSKLQANGYPALIPGSNGETIPIGRVYVNENSDGPQIVLVPKGVKFGPRSTPNRQATTNPRNASAPGVGVRGYQTLGYGGGYLNTDTVTIGPPDIAGGVQATASIVLSSQGGSIIRLVPVVVGTGYLNPPTVTINTSTGTGAGFASILALTSEMLGQLASRALFTDTQQFECHVWGITPAGGNTDTDFDAAQVLYQQLVASAWLLAPGIVRPIGGQWQDSLASSAQMSLRGHYIILGLEIDTPLPDQPLTYAPANVRPTITNSMQSPTGTIETGWTGTG